MDRQLGHIKVIDAVSIDQLSAESVIPSNIVNLCSGVFCIASYLFKGLLASESQIPPGNIQTGEKKIGAAGSLGQVYDLADIRELCVRLPPDLCIDTAAISAPASMADTGSWSEK